MSKKSTLLRDALKNMRVSAPSFKAPIETQKEAPRNEVPLFEATPSEVSQSEPPKKEAAHKEAPQSKVAQFEVAQPDIAQNQAPRNEAVGYEGTQIEPPQLEVPQDRESDFSFFRLSHRVFSDEKLQQMSGDCFRLFLWMASKAWRYPNSDGKVRAAIRFIEEGTGMSHANVSRCLKALKELDLIRIIQTDFKQGNIWWVSPLACPNGGGGRGLSKREAPQFKAAQDRNVATSRKGGSSPKKNTEVPRFEGEIKNLRNIKKIKEAQTVQFFETPETSYPSEAEINSAVQFFEQSESEDDQVKAINEYVARELPHGYLPPASILHRLVAVDWYKSHAVIQYPTVVNGHGY